VPDWIAALGTTGALLATLYIVVSDRRDGESRQDRQIPIFSTPEYHFSKDRLEAGASIEARDSDLSGVRVGLRNGSTAAISEAMVAVRPLFGTLEERRSFKFYHDATWEIIEPSDRPMSKQIAYSGPYYRDLDIFVVFKDVEGRSWRVGIIDRKPERYSLGDTPTHRRRFSQVLKPHRAGSSHLG
jgi:hypothetical protein